MAEQQDLAEAAPTAEVALLRSLALALAEARAQGTELPAPLGPSLDIWLEGQWLATSPPRQDRDFAQGYLAALEAAAAQCDAAAERRTVQRRASWNPLRRRRLRQGAAVLGAMAASLRLMAAGIRPQGG